VLLRHGAPCGERDHPLPLLSSLNVVSDPAISCFASWRSRSAQVLSFPLLQETRIRFMAECKPDAAREIPTPPPDVRHGRLRQVEWAIPRPQGGSVSPRLLGRQGRSKKARPFDGHALFVIAVTAPPGNVVQKCFVGSKQAGCLEPLQALRLEAFGRCAHSRRDYAGRLALRRVCGHAVSLSRPDSLVHLGARLGSNVCFVRRASYEIS